MEQIQTFDVLILGGPKSGKKRFAERLTKDIYNENAAYNQNLGVETCERESIVDGIKVMVNITVCSGRKRHLPIVQDWQPYQNMFVICINQKYNSLFVN